MIKLKTNSTQSTKEPIKKSVNQATQQVEDQDEEQGSDLINIKKKDKKQEKQKVLMQQPESVWQQNEDNNVKLNQPIPKAIEIKKVFNLGVLKGSEAQAVVTQEEEFPDLGQMMSQPQQKKPAIQSHIQVQKESIIIPTNSAGKSSFQNSKKGAEVTSFAINPVQQPQQAQPIQQLNVNNGPVTFKHTNKDEKKTALEQPTPIQVIQPVSVVQVQHEQPTQIIKRQEIVVGLQEVVIAPPKQIKFQNSNPVTLNQQVLVPQAQKEVVINATEEIKPVSLNFKAPTSFQNTKKEQTLVTEPIQNQQQQPINQSISQEQVKPQQTIKPQQSIKNSQSSQPVAQTIEKVIPQSKVLEQQQSANDDDWEIVQPKIKATHKK